MIFDPRDRTPLEDAQDRRFAAMSLVDRRITSRREIARIMRQGARA